MTGWAGELTCVFVKVLIVNYQTGSHGRVVHPVAVGVDACGFAAARHIVSFLSYPITAGSWCTLPENIMNTL